MEHDPAYELHVEVHHVPRHRLIADIESMLALRQPPRGIFHYRECFRQNLLELRPLVRQVRNRGELRLPLGRLSAKSVVGKRLELLIKLVNAHGERLQTLDFALIFRSEYLL